METERANACWVEDGSHLHKAEYVTNYAGSREPESWQEDWSLHGTQYTEDITNKINRYGMD